MHQAATDYFRPYNLHPHGGPHHHAAAAAANAAAAAAAAATAAHHNLHHPYHNLYGAAAAATAANMSPAVTHRIMPSPPSPAAGPVAVGGGSAADVNSSFSINSLAHQQQSPSNGGALASPPATSSVFRYDSLGQQGHHSLYSGYSSGFEYGGLMHTTHIPLGDPFSQPSQPTATYPARPQPTRPLIGSTDVSGGRGAFVPVGDSSTSSSPMSVSSGNNNNSNSNLLQSSRSHSSPNAAAPSPAAAAAKDKLNNNAAKSSSTKSSNNNSNHNSPQQQSAAAVANMASNNNNDIVVTSSSPNNCSSPAAATTATGGSNNSNSSNNHPLSSDKFRYPSGPSNNSSSVQSTSSSPPAAATATTEGTSTSGPGRGPGPGTPSSAMSSREGTPLPPVCKMEEDGPVPPNVDISRVQLKEFAPSNAQSAQSPTSGDFSPPAIPLMPSSSAAPSSGSAFAQHHPSYGALRAAGRSSVYSGFDMDTSGDSLLGSNRHQSGSSSSTSTTSTGGGGSGGGGHHHPHHHGPGKIGRRPGHLPKVLKYSDHTLPPGWVRKLKQRKHGKQAGRWDVYIYSPCGVKFASRKKLKGFFEKNNLNYDPEDFDFTPYGRHIDSRAAIGGAGSSNNSGGSGVSSNPASRHNSSGSTGSEGTKPGSSPASIANYSPTHVHTPYLPQTSFLMGSATQHPSLMAPPSSASSSTVTSGIGSDPASFADYNTFVSFDHNMPNPPNASALDVPGAFPPPPPLSSAASDPSSSSSSIYSNHLTLPYHHLGRGHHHPIVKGEHLGAGSEFFPSAEMAEILGNTAAATSTTTSSSIDHSAHNGLVGFYPSTSSSSGLPPISSASASTVGLQPLSNSSANSRTSDEDDGKSSVKPEPSPSHHHHHHNLQQQHVPVAASADPAVTAATSSAGSGFSLGRTMSVLQENQDGFEDYTFY